MSDTPPEGERRRWFHLSQETIAIVTVGIALATLMLTTTAGIRNEARADREAWERRFAEADAAWKAESHQLRAEQRANREASERRIAETDAAWKAETRQLRAEAQANYEHFQREILRLTGETARLAARDQ